MMKTKRNIQLLPVLTALVGLAIFIAAVWVLVREVNSVSLAEIGAQFSAIPPHNFAVAGLFTAASYLLLTGYDFLAIRYLGQNLPYPTIAPISFSAFAVGHNVGIASLSGGAIRYRAYSLAGLATNQIAAIILFIVITFSLGSAALLGIVLLTEPESALSPFPLGEHTLRVAGAALLSMPMVYLVLAGSMRGPLKIGQWSLSLPSLKIGLYQLLLACLDLLVASLVLYFLIGPSAELQYLTFLGAYLLAMFIGVASTVPGGIGVFESSLVLLLPEVPTAQLLGAIVAYRLIYYMIPLMAAIVLIAGREAVEHRERLSRFSRAGLTWGTRILPQAIGATVFVAGAYLLVRGSIPLRFGHTGLVETMVPLPLLEMSHLLSSAIGAGLLIVARGLYRRQHRAWEAAIVLMSAGIVVSVIQYNGLIHVLILGILLILAWISRTEFYRGRRLLEQRFDAVWFANMVLVLIAVIGIGLFAHRHVEYSSELWWQFSLDGEASRMMRAGLLALVLVGLFAFRQLLRGGGDHVVGVGNEALPRVKKLVETSPSSFSNIALLGDKRFLFHPSGDAFVMYQVSGSSWIALGDPIGDTERFEELLWLYLEACDQDGARCVFYEVSDDYLPMYIDLGLSFFKLGEEGFVDLTEFDLEGSHRAGLRQAVNRAKRHGAAYSVVPAPAVPALLDQLAAVSASWLARKSAAEKGFSLGFFEPRYISNFDCAVVSVDNEIVAFANLWKGAGFGELSLDLMRYTDRAPRGIMDYLFAETMLWGKARGYGRFSLGMAPLSGLEYHMLASRWQKLGNLVYHFGEHFYSFEGLRSYKEKFRPEWEPRFLACKGGLTVTGAILDTTMLISGGVRGLVQK